MRVANIITCIVLAASLPPALPVAAKIGQQWGADERPVYLYYSGTYLAKHDRKEANNGEKAISELMHEKRQSVLLSDLKELSVMFSAEQLRAQNAELELANAKRHRMYGMIIAAIIIFMVALLLAISVFHMRNMAKKNKALAEARDRAEELSRMKTEFIHNVSHEIRTPLNSIVGFSRLLTDKGIEVTEEEKEEYAGAISMNTLLLTKIISDILDLADLKSGSGINLNIAPCGCNETCRQAIGMVRSDIQDGVELRFTTDVDDGFSLATDQKRLEQVLFNFLSNACKYTSKGYIDLDFSATRRKGYATFTVTDTGCGIPIEKHQSVFRGFDKAGSMVQGFGIGLKICAEIARLMKADIGIDPGYTGGARFYFAVPQA